MADRHLLKQAYRSPGRRLTWLLVLLVLVTSLGACGKKPNQLDPPPGAQENVFPRIYPDPATDPKP